MRLFFLVVLLLTARCWAAEDQQKLLKLLHSDTPKLQEVAVRRLGAHGTKEAFDPVVALFGKSSTSPRLKASIVRALIGIDEERATPFLIDLIRNSPELELRLLAIRHLGRPAYPAIESMLIEYLAQADQDAVKSAILNTFHFFKGDPRVAHALTKELPREMSDQLFDQVTQLVQTLEIEDAVDPLLQLFSQAEEKRKERIIQTLGHLSDGTVAPLLLEHLQDGSRPRLQASAIEALGNLGIASAIPKIRPILSAPSIDLQLAAVAALTKLGDQDSAPMILTIYADYTARYSSVLSEATTQDTLSRIAAIVAVRTALIQAISTLSPQTSTEVCLDGVHTKNPFTERTLRRKIASLQLEAFECLVQSKGASVNDLLVEKILLHSPSLEIRNRSIAILLETEGLALSERLIDELKSGKTAELRASAAYALGGLQSQQFLQPLTEALNDPSELVVKEALLALSELPGVIDATQVAEVGYLSSSDEIKRIANALLSIASSPGAKVGTHKLQAHFAGRYIDKMSSRTDLDGRKSRRNHSTLDTGPTQN